MTQQPTHGNRRPDEIESDIEQTRSRLDDTLNQLERKFSPQQWMNDTYDYVRHGGANDFVTNLGDTVKRNPMPVVLAGVGLGWLMLSSSQRKSHRDDHDGDHYDYPATSTASATPPTHNRAMATPIAGAPTTGAGTTSYGTDPTSTDHTGRQGGGQGRMHAAKDKARHMVGGASDRTTHAKDSSRAAMGNLSHRAQRAGSDASHFVQEHPLVAGALGIALGAALGGLMPSTRAEDDYLGETRNKVLDKAATAGQQQADKAQAKMQEKGEQASSSDSTDRTTPGTSSSHATSASHPSSPVGTESTGQKTSPVTSTPASSKTSPDRPLSSNPGTDSPINPNTDNPPTRGG